ncbi:hypothetical protein ACIBQ3_10655 [Streptomyces rubiginosohelvolus]|uniref:hypothetical protein n=1 Tax=Streptomyces rubiginosohelvolus TaxID=67362 RepID=UPI0037A02FBC
MSARRRCQRLADLRASGGNGEFKGGEWAISTVLSPALGAISSCWAMMSLAFTARSCIIDDDLVSAESASLYSLMLWIITIPVDREGAGVHETEGLNDFFMLGDSY